MGKYDSAAASLFGESPERDRTDVSLSLAVNKKPEEVIKQRQIAQEIGTDTGFVERNQKEATSLAEKRKIDLEGLKSKAPKTHDWLGNPKNADVAWDDIANLMSLEESQDGNLADLVVAGAQETAASFNLQGIRVATERLQSLEDQITGLPSGFESTRGRGTSTISGLPVDRFGKPLVGFSGQPLGESKDAIQASIETLRDQQLNLDTSRRNATKAMMNLAGEAGKVKYSPSVQTAIEQEEFTPALKAFSEHPLNFILEVSARSAAPSVAALGGGLAGSPAGPVGFAIGLGAGSAGVDFVAEFRGNLQEAGIDVNNVDSVLGALENKELMNDISKKSALHAAFVGAIDGITGGIASKFIAPKAMIGTLAGELVNVTAQMGVQAFGGAAGEYLGSAAAGKDVGWGELLAEAGGELVTAPVDVVMARGVAIDRKTDVAVKQMQKTRVDVGSATDSKARMDMAVEAAKNSKLRKNDPVTFRDIASQVMGEDSMVGLSADDTKTFFQENPEAEDSLAKSNPELYQQIQASMAVGSPIRIPAAQYLADMTEWHDFISDKVRVNDNAFNYVEAVEATEQFNTDMQQQAETIVESETDVFQQSADKVFDYVQSQITDTGRFSPEVAAQDAELHRAFAIVRANQLGITPEQVYEQFGMSVTGVPVSDGLAQPSGTIDDVVSTWEEAGIQASMAERADSINLSKIIVPKADRGEGKGTQAMQQLVEYSDAVGKRIDLSPSTDFGGGKARLIKFYKSLGFVENKGRNKNDAISESMYREPQGIEGQLYQDAQQIEVEGVMRSTLNANGQPIHQTVDGIKNFWRWFGDSKVVDSEGRPLVVYHGTGETFEEISLEEGAQGLFWFTTDKAAVESGEVGAAKKGIIMELYANIENPADWGKYSDLGFYEYKQNNLDGAMLSEGDEFIGFIFDEPTQIKSVDNVGSFSATDPNIFRQAKRGAISFGDTATISLLETADLSTFLHESGHFFLETTAHMAAMADAPQEIIDDMNLMLDYIGEPDLNAWLAKSIDERRAGHEKIADAFEKYLMEGKAPSLKLQDAFNRFRAWLLDVYSRLKGSGVELTDEVRGVFDRMLASQEEIDSAIESQGMYPIFESAEEAGMSDAEYAKYHDDFLNLESEAMAEHQTRSIKDMKYLDNAKSKAMKSLQREAKDARRAMRQEVSDEVNNRRVFVTRSFLVKGTIPGGLPESIKPMKLSRKDIDEMYGTEITWRSLPRGSTVNGGEHPDVVAAIFGYNNGDEMIRDIIQAGDPRDVISDTTDQRMLERYGDMFTPEQIENAAMEAVQGKARQKILSTELNVINKRSGRVAVPLKAVKAYAQRIIAMAKVPESVKFNQYLQAERRAGKATEAALKQDDIGEAAVQKRNQVVQQSLYRESRDASKEVPKMLRYLKRFNKKTIRQKMTAEYLDQIDAILVRYDLSNMSLKAIGEKASLIEWMESEQKKNGVMPDIPEYIVNNLDSVSYKSLSLEQFRGMYNSVKEIENFGRFKKRLLENKAKRDLYETVDVISASLEENNEMGYKDRAYSPSLKEKVADKSAGAAAALFNIEMLFRMLDGDKLGALSENVFAPISEASDKAFARKAAVARDFRELITSLYSKAELTRFSGLGAKRYHVEGIKGGFTKENLISIALNFGNEHGRQRLSNDFSEAQISQALSHLTEADTKLLEAIWLTFDEQLWPDLAKLERDFHAEAPAKVDPAPFEINGIEVRGGYYPLKYDPKRGNQEKIIDERMSLEDFTSGYAGKAVTKQGHAKERVKHVGASLRLDLGVFAAGVADTIQDIEMRRVVVDAYKIISNPQFSESFKSAAGVNAYEILEPWLRDIAVPPEGPKGGINKVIANFRSNTAIVAMGLSVKTGLLNITGYFQAFDADDVGVAKISKYAGKFFLNPLGMKKMQDYVFDKSSYMTNRANTFDRDVRTSMKSMSAKGTLTPEGFSWFYLIAMTDKGVTIPTWMAAYEKSMKDTDNNEEKSIKFADHIIRATQGSGREIDLSSIQRGMKDNRELYKAFTMFYSFFNATLNRNIRSINLLKERGITDIPRFVASFVFLNIMPAVISAYLSGFGPEDDEDEKAWAAAETLKFMFGQVPFVRDIAGVAIDKISGQYAFPYRVTPVAGAAEQAVMGPMKIISDFVKDDVDEKTLKQALLTGGVYFGIPSRQIWRTTEHLIHVESGESEFSPIDLLMGEKFKRR